jgi:hypothetical protein
MRGVLQIKETKSNLLDNTVSKSPRITEILPTVIAPGKL